MSNEEARAEFLRQQNVNMRVTFRMFELSVIMAFQNGELAPEFVNELYERCLRLAGLLRPPTGGTT